MRDRRMVHWILEKLEPRQMMAVDVHFSIDALQSVHPISRYIYGVNQSPAGYANATMFRSGGSEYRINGNNARLLDVQELLSDSGLGREMHVIVGQGQLDTVLRATPCLLYTSDAADERSGEDLGGRRIIKKKKDR